MASSRGIFLLSEALRKTKANLWPKSTDVWISPSPFVSGSGTITNTGYFGGGNSTTGSSSFSSVERTDYTNDTATAVI